MSVLEVEPCRPGSEGLTDIVVEQETRNVPGSPHSCKDVPGSSGLGGVVWETDEVPGLLIGTRIVE